jgi:hypothetical protein
MKTILIVIGVLIAINAVYAFLLFILAYLKANLLRKVGFNISLSKGGGLEDTYYYLNLKTPFYDEKKHFYLGFPPVTISFIPVETIPVALNELFKDKYLLQTERDGAIPCKSPRISDALNESKIEVCNGLFIYSPESISLNGLNEVGFSDGRDILFIIGQRLSEDKMQGLNDKDLEWLKMSARDRILDRREYFQSEGEIVKFLDRWQIIHRDEDFIRKAISLIFQKIGEKAVKKAGFNKRFLINAKFTDRMILLLKNSVRRIKVFVKGNKIVFQCGTFKQAMDLT